MVKVRVFGFGFLWSLDTWWLVLGGFVFWGFRVGGNLEFGG